MIFRDHCEAFHMISLLWVISSEGHCFNCADWLGGSGLQHGPLDLRGRSNEGRLI